MSDEGALIPADYQEFLGDLKARIRAAQIRAAVAVNRELIVLYWQIGWPIQERQETDGRGAQVIDSLSTDLRYAFPEMKGFSPRNLRYTHAFAASYPDPDFLQQVAAKLPWGHIMRLLDTVSESHRTRVVRTRCYRAWLEPIRVGAPDRGEPLRPPGPCLSTGSRA